MSIVNESRGPRFLQEANLSTPWYLAFRYVSLRDKELQKHKNVLAFVRLAEHSLVTSYNTPKYRYCVSRVFTERTPISFVCALLQSAPK